MKQHSVQSAYLKQFSINGRIWCYENGTKRPKQIPPKNCTTEVDFQDIEIENEQNKEIEKPAIESMRKILQKGTIDDVSAELLLKWSALHLIRNQKYRSHKNINYSKDYREIIAIEDKFNSYFEYITILKCNHDNFFITSDNPVLELNIDSSRLRFFTLSPTHIILMSNITPNIETEIDFCEMINSTLYANRHKYVFSDRKNLPLDRYADNSKKFNLVGQLSTSTFAERNI